GVWLTDNGYELLGKSPAQSFTVYLQPFMTPGTLLRISISWVVVLVVSGLSLVLMVQGILQVPIEGSVPLFMLGVALSLFATTS
ncbi:hypothetical protein C6H70_30385, partial [Klebsiella pneumoniae]